MAAFVRAMEERDVPEALRIMRLAFGTFTRAADPENFHTDRDYVSTRWRSRPEAALVAEVDGRIVGSNLLTGWGSFGFFGPLTVAPEFWEKKVAQDLLARTLEMFAEWGVRDLALFTFASSPKHVGLYQKFGLWPRFLTAILTKTARVSASPALCYSTLSPDAQEEALQASRDVTGSIYAGLDVRCEIRSVFEQQLGDTVLLRSGESLDGFAICHCGPGTEAGTGNCYIKFAATRGEASLERLLADCEALAVSRGLDTIEVGVNTGRLYAYRKMLALGYRAQMLGVAMHHPESGGYDRADAFVLDDLR